MKILCCCKLVPDLELMKDTQWQIGTKDKFDTSFIRNIWNCYDESALEMILRLSETSEGFKVISEINALTLGNKLKDSYLKLLYALNYNNTVRIDCEEEDIHFQPRMIAAAISEYILNFGKEDVIVTGIASADTNDAKVGFYLAEILNYPCISNVIDLKILDEDKLQVISLIDDIQYTYEIKTPCVLSIGDVPCSYLRVPTLRNKLKVKSKKVKVFNFYDFMDNNGKIDINRNKNSSIYKEDMQFEYYEGVQKFRAAKKIDSKDLYSYIDKLKSGL